MHVRAYDLLPGEDVTTGSAHGESAENW